MSDTDAFLWKCSLELIEQGVPSDKIQEQCACMMGFASCADSNQSITLKQGE